MVDWALREDSLPWPITMDSATDAMRQASVILSVQSNNASGGSKTQWNSVIEISDI